MIQEKDFLYRVPVKTAPITTPGGQIRNPEILVDVEGGEFMHGNILDANSTNKLINQSVKDAVDNKLNESGYVTKDLLEAETTRATGVENNLKTAIDGKQPKGNYLTEHQSLEEYAKKTDIPEIDTSDFVSKTAIDAQSLKSNLSVSDCLDVVDNSTDDYRTAIRSGRIEVEGYGETSLLISNRNLHFSNNDAGIALDGDNGEITISSKDFLSGQQFRINKRGIYIPGGDNNHVLTTGNSTIDITQYALKSELPTVPTKTSQLTNDSNFMAANVVQDTYFGLEKELKIYSEADNKITTVSHNGIRLETNSNDFVINENGFFVSRDSDDTHLCTFTPSGIRFEGKTASDIPTAGGDFIELSSLASAEDISSLRVGLSKKQNKITVNTVDITDIETADVTKLRTIVTNLINALSSSGLINATDGVE